MKNKNEKQNKKVRTENKWGKMYENVSPIGTHVLYVLFTGGSCFGYHPIEWLLSNRGNYYCYLKYIDNNNIFSGSFKWWIWMMSWTKLNHAKLSTTNDEYIIRCVICYCTASIYLINIGGKNEPVTVKRYICHQCHRLPLSIPIRITGKAILYWRFESTW